MLFKCCAQQAVEEQPENAAGTTDGEEARVAAQRQGSGCGNDSRRDDS